ncbi:MAG: hypothetical protein JF571_00830 [Asticcacaulis sp.]|nr:hypothetical protein [Asticcacaulis sp.]
MDFLSWFKGDRQERETALKIRDALDKATGAATAELNSFFDELAEVVIAFNQKHILFGDRYFRLKFKLQPIRLPMDYRVKCAQLRAYADFFSNERAALTLAAEAEAFHDFVMDHNYDTLIRFLGYDNSVRKLLHTIDEVHLRQLVTLVSGGEAGGSPLGVNMLIHDFDNVGAVYAGKRQGFVDLKKGIGALKLQKPLS